MPPSPRGVATAAIEYSFADKDELRRCRKPEIMGEAARAILLRDARKCTGNFFIDEDVLRAAGETDFSKYTTETGPLVPDLFLDE